MRKVKIILLGDSCVGKTTLIHRYISDEYRNDFKATLATDITTKILTRQDVDVEANIWDTAGTERFKSIAATHYRGADACILVFDFTSLETFKNVKNWKESVINSAGIENIDTFPFIVVGNKFDIQNEIQIERSIVEELCEKNSMKFFPVSAKTDENVKEAFEYAIDTALFQKKTPPAVNIDTLETKSKKCFC